MDLRTAAAHIPAAIDKLASFIKKYGRITILKPGPGGAIITVGLNIEDTEGILKMLVSYQASFVERAAIKAAISAQPEALAAAAAAIEKWAEQKINTPKGGQADRLTIGLTKREGRPVAIACNEKGECFALWDVSEEAAQIGQDKGEEEE